jgi:altronate dehydratase
LSFYYRVLAENVYFQLDLMVVSVPEVCANVAFFISEAKVSEKKKLSEKIKEKENRLRKKQQELKKNVSLGNVGLTLQF